MLFAPLTSGMVCNMEQRAQGNIVGKLGWPMAEVVGSAGCGRREWDWRVVGREKKAGGKSSQSSQVIDVERYQGNVVGIEGVDDGLCGGDF